MAYVCGVLRNVVEVPELSRGCLVRFLTECKNDRLVIGIDDRVPALDEVTEVLDRGVDRE